MKTLDSLRWRPHFSLGCQRPTLSRVTIINMTVRPFWHKSWCSHLSNNMCLWSEREIQGMSKHSRKWYNAFKSDNLEEMTWNYWSVTQKYVKTAKQRLLQPLLTLVHRSRLADFISNCQPEVHSISGCLRENYADCLLSYSGLIGKLIKL